MNTLAIRRQVQQKSLLYLSLLYLAALITRYLIALSWSDNPWIMPDEALYANLARSLWTKGQVLFRGQPIKYDSLLYPLLLSPLYGLGCQADTFRAIQLFNAFMINAWVFPMWYLARSVTGSQKSAWVVAVICLLLPDMALSQQVMTESLAYPLTALLFLLAYRSFSSKARPWDLYLSSVLCALLYFTKSGLVALGISLSFVYWYFFFKNRQDKAALLRALTFSLSFAAGLFLLRFLTQNILGVDYAKQSIYEKQTQSFSFGHVMMSLQGMLLYAFFFPACCLILPMVIPLSHQKKLETPQQLLLLFAKAALTLMILGITYIIYIDELTANPLASRIHIRYLAAFIPLFLMLSLSKNLQNARPNTTLMTWLGFLSACTLVLTAEAFLSNRKYPVDALILSPIAENWWGLGTKPLFTIALIFLIFMSGWHLFKQGWTQRVQRAVILSLSLWLILANLSGYNLMSHNRGDDWARDALEVTKLVGDRPFVFVAEDSGYQWNPASALDIRLKKARPFVELDDLIENTGSGGIYQAFVPKAYWTENPLTDTGEAEYLVMNNDFLSRIALTPQTELSASQGLHYALLTLPEDSPWIHSALSGFDSIGWVGKKSRLSVFDEALNLKDFITVSLNLHAAEEDTTLIVSSGDFSQLIPVPRDSAWVMFRAPVLSNPFTLAFSAGKAVYITTYTVE